MELTFKTQAYVADKATEQYIERAFGVRRWVWNWTLSRFKQEKKKTNWLPNWYDLAKELRSSAKERKDKGFSWYVDQMVSSRVLEETMKDVKQAYALCRQQRKKKKNWNKNIQPQFKSRRDLKQTFSMYLANQAVFRIDQFEISFTADGKSRGRLRVREDLTRFQNTKLKRLTIKREAGKLWITIAYEIPNRGRTCGSGKVGIDLGVKKSAVCFDGQNLFEASFNISRSRKCDRLSKKNDIALSRAIRGSNRYKRLLELKEKRAARATRIRNQRLEEFTTFLVRNYNEFVVDDFAFYGAIEVSDRKELYRCMKYQFKLRLQQKCEETGAIFRTVSHQRGVKTTHKCAVCGSEDVRIPKGTRVVECRNCGHVEDRDSAAAKNTFLL